MASQNWAWQVNALFLDEAPARWEETEPPATRQIVG